MAWLHYWLRRRGVWMMMHREVEARTQEARNRALLDALLAEASDYELIGMAAISDARPTEDQFNRLVIEELHRIKTADVSGAFTTSAHLHAAAKAKSAGPVCENCAHWLPCGADVGDCLSPLAAKDEASPARTAKGHSCAYHEWVW